MNPMDGGNGGGGLGGGGLGGGGGEGGGGGDGSARATLLQVDTHPWVIVPLAVAFSVAVREVAWR
jgi:hypothetical protein